VRTKSMILAPIREHGRPIASWSAICSTTSGRWTAGHHAFRDVCQYCQFVCRSHPRLPESRSPGARTDDSLEAKTRELERVNAELRAAKTDLEIKNLQNQQILTELARSRNELQAVFDSSLSLLIFVDKTGASLPATAGNRYFASNRTAL